MKVKVACILKWNNFFIKFVRKNFRFKNEIFTKVNEHKLKFEKSFLKLKSRREWKEWQIVFKDTEAWIRVPKVPFRVFDKLETKFNILNLYFVCYSLNTENENQITDYYFHV